MIVAYGILIPAVLLILWAFFRYSPKGEQSGKVRLYNVISLVVAIGLSAGFGWYLRMSMHGGSDYGWWPVLAFLASLVICIVVLTVSGLFRNLVVFRRRGA